MIPISPRDVLAQVAHAVPENCRGDIIIIGSLAVAHHFFGNDPEAQVRTKDVDCLVSPHIMAIPTGKAVAERLFKDRWQFRSSEQWPIPGNASTPDDNLPALRLNPPDSTDWFIELITVPTSPEQRGQHWLRLETSAGHFGIGSFRFLSLVDYEPTPTEFGIAIARPEMMALANLLEHPTIGTQATSTLIGGRIIKRSNKDLGRVLAIARLSSGDAVARWPDLWAKALAEIFQGERRDLARRAGSGLRQLLDEANEPDLDEAHHSVAYGLLVSRPPTMGELRATGLRLLKDAVEPLERLANS